MMSKRTLLVWGVAILCFIVLMVVTPKIPQSEQYHDFADQREFFGIPNMLNVVSNFPFFVIGAIGLILCYYRNYFRLRSQGELLGWTCFFIGVTAVAFGSAYYHLKPNDARLVWDRLPMTIAFTSIISIFIIERVDEKWGTLSILPLLLTGIVSILYWWFFDDLRPYALVQFVPCIAIPLMTILLPPMYTHSLYWLWAADEVCSRHGEYPGPRLKEMAKRWRIIPVLIQTFRLRSHGVNYMFFRICTLNGTVQISLTSSTNQLTYLKGDIYVHEK
ncbi:uncharacterized protein [Coffea arabica]|uniref:Uncharacterized protein isoform X3 n=1 Tax=Coffea arabica TaxID=13443 RepID=A0ABM4WVS6_COFAR